MQMLDDDLFAGDKLHAREVEVSPGKTVTLHFRELPATAFIKFHNIASTSDEDAKAGAAARLIAESLCNPDGSRAMPLDKALTLKPIPLNALFAAVLEVNAADGADPGNS